MGKSTQVTGQCELHTVLGAATTITSLAAVSSDVSLQYDSSEGNSKYLRQHLAFESPSRNGSCH